jgi:UDP-N-acetyl-D-galactosamine dehydrogenase
VDPYYLTAKAQELGYHPEVILSGRRVNDSMGSYIAQRLIKLLSRHDLPLKDLRVGILGFNFKENVHDIRNSKVIDIYAELASFGLIPLVHDPLADPDIVAAEHEIVLSAMEDLQHLHALILAVPHELYGGLDARYFSRMLDPGGIFVDVKSGVSPELLREDIRYWSL